MKNQTGQCENNIISRLSASHRTLHTEIIIDAAPEQVWTVLCDTQSYKYWARFLVAIEGDIKDGSKITAVFQINPEKKKYTRIEHTISVIKGKEFYWAEKGPMGIRDNHHFRVEATDCGKSRFVQSDELIGGATWLVGGTFSKAYLKGYDEFNKSLKMEVESGSPNHD